MGYKSFLRSAGSAMRQIERDSIRRQKEYERRRKEYSKLKEVEQAKLEVEEYENYLELIQSLHKDCNECIEWEEITKTTKPTQLTVFNENEKKSTDAYNNYRPSFIDNIFKLLEKKKQKLLKNIEKAKQKDKEINERNIDEYNNKLNEWEKSVNIATNVLKGNSEIYMEVVKEMSPFEEIENIGSKINFNVIKNDFMEIDFNVLEDKVIPKEIKGLLKSGKLTVKQMPVGKFNEIYQDYVCSAVLRISREIFALLPIEKVLINAISNMLNTKTGHKEDMVIISVLIPRKTLTTINFENIDPSDSMKNFVHNGNFNKSKGFSSVDKIDSNKYL